MSNVIIRPAAAVDLPIINDIYNHYVLHSTCTYQTELETAKEREAWFERHGVRHPVVVAEMQGTVLGWGALSPFRARAAYGRTVENSVYVRHDAQRRGIGKAVLEQLIARAGQIGHHTIVAIIDAEQTPSIALHAQFGFVEAGRLRQVGFKFGRWLDVIDMQKML